MNRKRITAYYADWVRGPAGKENGDAVSQSVIDENLKLAVVRCNYLRGLTGWSIYCPHEAINERVVAAGWREGLITSRDILLHSSEIVKACSVFIVGGDPEQSDGVKFEMETAIEADEIIMLAFSFWTPLFGGNFIGEDKMAAAMLSFAEYAEGVICDRLTKGTNDAR